MYFVLNVIACMDTPVQTVNIILPTLIWNMTVPIVSIGYGKPSYRCPVRGLSLVCSITNTIKEVRNCNQTPFHHFKECDCCSWSSCGVIVLLLSL